MRLCPMLFACALLLASAPAFARDSGPKIYAWAVQNGTLLEGCNTACLKSNAGRFASRRGVKKATVDGEAIKLEIAPHFRAEDALIGIDGFRIEMRVPYKGIELNFVPNAPFPPWPRIEDDLLIVDLGEDARKAMETGAHYRPIDRMKCVGKLTGPEANEAVLNRFEREKKAPVTMIPFMAEADIDGDKRADLYFKLEGLPAIVIFNKKSGLVAKPLKAVGTLEDIPRCDMTPSKFVRGVKKKDIKCGARTDPPHAGDAFEIVDLNHTSTLLMWNGTEFVSCPTGSEGGEMPTEGIR